MAQTITVRIKDGNIEMKAEGFAGRACQVATADLSRALGRTVKDTPTAEMFGGPGGGMKVEGHQ